MSNIPGIIEFEEADDKYFCLKLYVFNVTMNRFGEIVCALQNIMQKRARHDNYNTAILEQVMKK